MALMIVQQDKQRDSMLSETHAFLIVLFGGETIAQHFVQFDRQYISHIFQDLFLELRAIKVLSKYSNISNFL